MPISSPRSFTTAFPLHDGLEGATTSPRSSMYSHEAEKRRISRREPATHTRSLSSSTPTVPVRAPATPWGRNGGGPPPPHDGGRGRDVVRGERGLGRPRHGENERGREQPDEDEPQERSTHESSERPQRGPYCRS